MPRSPRNPALARLRAIVAKAPLEPGVYRWLSAKGEVLYVGKAKNLRNRLKSYVQAGARASLGLWKQALMERAADMELTVTRSEIEALVLETNLIKELRPKYNVMMKDDKNYVYVRISMQDAYPSVTVVRRMEDDAAKYFGPFLSAMQIRDLLEALHIVFPYRSAKETLERLNRRAEKGEDSDEPLFPSAPLEVQIGRHCGVGFGTSTRAQYLEAIDALLRFFRGDHAEAAARLTEEMQRAAAERKFERAAQIRNALATIRELEREKQVVSDTSGENADVIGIALLKGRSQVVVLRERGGKLLGESSFSLAGEPESAAAVLAQFLPQYYATTTDVPEVILAAALPEEREVLEQWLSERRGGAVHIAVPERGKKAQLLAMAERNAEEKITQQLAKWEAAAKQRTDTLAELASILGLPHPPKRIEGYDISHLGGTETVGSMAVLKEGKAVSDQYRSFTIRTLREGQIDDYKALAEVLRRRLAHIAQSAEKEAERWRERGITLGKPRKAERERITALLAGHGLDTEEMEWSSAIVARDGEEVIGFARLRAHPGGVRELASLFIAERERGNRLGHLLARAILKREKKGKVYLIAEEALGEYYAELGFRHVLAAPKPLAEELARVCSSRLKRPVVLLYDVREHRSDASLSAAPDLLLIDGGKGQLSAVAEVLRALDLAIPAIGLAKREEEVFLLDCHSERRRRVTVRSIAFPKDSEAKFLLMRLRDEAHRFANRHREQRLAKRAVSSSLDQVPGIGPRTRAALLKAFGSAERVRGATDEELRAHLSAAQIAALRGMRDA